MRRREFITLLGGASAAWPLTAHAQLQTMALIGVLGSGFARSSAILIDAFKEGMRENGLVEGRNYVLDVRWAEGDYKRFAPLASELAQLRPSVIIVTTIAAGRAAQQAAPTTPIVMTGLIDPVGNGLVASLSRPGGNITGISSISQDTTVKGLELLRTVVPKLKVVAALFNPLNPGNRLIMEDLRNQAATLEISIHPLEFKGPDTLDSVIDTLVDEGALLIVGDAALIDVREQIAALALHHRLPTVTSVPEFTDVGALIGYGPSRRAIYRSAATYVKKILDGAKPADLPVEQPTLIELSINMQTARALDLTIPDTLIARADRVIE
jgi:putative ABC transport system substrate-binding protein